jgi:hypothetical protein
MISEVREKVLTQKVKTFSENLKNKSYYINELQKLVNKIVRIRDVNNSCISCDKILTNKIKYDAGHCYPSTYSFLRFNLDNIHAQCVQCNRDLHGNINEYKSKLEIKIGSERLQWLHAHRHDKSDYNIEWLKEQIKYYKLKLKENE